MAAAALEEGWRRRRGDASGIVYAVGEDVDSVSIGDEVIVHHGWWDRDDPWVRAGRDPMIAPSARIWGYQTDDGAFAQFAVAASAPTSAQAGAPQLG